MIFMIFNLILAISPYLPFVCNEHTSSPDSVLKSMAKTIVLGSSFSICSIKPVLTFQRLIELGPGGPSPITNKPDLHGCQATA